MKILYKTSGFISKISEIFAGILIASLTTVLILQVILRTFFSSGIYWAVEFSTFAIIWAVMLMGNVLIKNNGLITVNFFDHKLSLIFIKIRDIIYQVIFLILFIILIYYGTDFAMQGLSSITPSLRIPWFYVFLSIPLGSGLMFIQYVIKIIINLEEIKTNRKRKQG